MYVQMTCGRRMISQSIAAGACVTDADRADLLDFAGEIVALLEQGPP